MSNRKPTWILDRPTFGVLFRSDGVIILCGRRAISLGRPRLSLWKRRTVHLDRETAREIWREFHEGKDIQRILITVDHGKESDV